ncbi:Abi-alpha family protein [Prauserella endophytica]|uniref:Abi-alpha family protein n=1 Tax=Prauserella endophytica TaxID=1592324 RepID=UPI001476D038|nr:Abi-alpha family protein [Prauserella endophytica]
MDSEDLVQRAGRIAGWAARTGYSLGRRLPGADSAERSLRTLEQKALGELRRRLEGAGDPYLATLNQAPSTGRNLTNGQVKGRAVTVVTPDEPLRVAMAELLNRSTGLDRDRSRDYLYAVILRQLTPDEARILAALADGSPFPLVDVAERTGLGGAGRVVLRNASTVGKAAGVTLLDHVPAYVTRLVGLGLADIDEEAPALSTQYEILLTDDTVRAAEQLVKRPRFVRRTVRISPLGVSFWQACAPK